MSPRSKRQAASVGLFVTVGAGIALAALAAVGNLSDMFADRTTVVANFDTVDGLKAGDAVWFSGVSVGMVKRAALAPGSKVRVELAIDQERAKHIPHDVVATLSSDGLIGNAIVVLDEGTVGGEPLVDGSELAVAPSLSASQLMAEVQQTNKQLQGVIGNIDQITDPLAAGEGTVGRLIHDDHIYTEATHIVTDLRGAARDAESFAANLNEPGHLAHDLATDDTSYASFSRSLESLENTAEEAEGIATSFSEAANNTETPLGVVLHDREAGGDLEETFSEMHESSELLSENLEAMQHNFLLRGFFKKKEKEEARRRGKKLATEGVATSAKSSEAPATHPAAMPTDDELLPL